MVKRANAWLREKLEVDQLPWWSSLGPLGVRRHLWPLAWHKAAISEEGMDGSVVWNPAMRCYDLSVRLGSVTFDERAGHIHAVLAAVERIKSQQQPVKSVLG